MHTNTKSTKPTKTAALAAAIVQLESIRGPHLRKNPVIQARLKSLRREVSKVITEAGKGNKAALRVQYGAV